MSSGLKGLLYRRFIDAGQFSMQGFKACFQHEEAFRVEVFLAILLTPLAFYIGDSMQDLVLLFGSMFIVLITELLNSAVEAVVDLVSLEKSELAGRAKDQGSAAVLLSMILFVLVWGVMSWGTVQGLFPGPNL